MKEKHTKKGGAKKVLKIIGIIILVLILLVAIASASGYIYLKKTVGDIVGDTEQVEVSLEETEINENVEQSLSEYRTIALFGVDSRGNQLRSGTRSDCIILAVINDKNKTVNLVSVYRDTYLQLSGKSLDKITHAYAYGGAQLAINSLNTNLDLNITEFATVNFNVLVDIVDSLGGITLNINSEEVKYINSYIDETSRVTGKSASGIYSAGTYNLNGVQAVAYSRIRYTSGGDYKRTERMRTVLVAIGEKAKKMGITQLIGLVNKLKGEVYTNISADEVIRMLPQIASYSISENIGWPYEVKGATIGGVWYGVPVTLEDSVKKLHKEVYGQEDYQVSEKVKSISNSIISKTGYR